MQSPSRSTSSELLKRNQRELSLSCFMQLEPQQKQKVQQLSSYQLDEKVQNNQGNSRTHLPNEEEEDAGLALRIDDKFNEASLSASKLEKLKLHDDDNWKLTNIEERKRKEEYEVDDGEISEFHLIKRLKRIARHRDELKSLDNRLFHLSAQYMSHINTNSSYDMDNNSMMLNNSIGMQNASLFTYSSSSIKSEQVQQPPQASISFLHPYHMDSSVAIDLSKKSLKSPIDQATKEHFSTDIERDIDNCQKRKFPITTTSTTINFKKSRLLAANSLIMAPHVPISPKRTDTQPDPSSIDISGSIVEQQQFTNNTTNEPITAISVMEPKHKKFQSDFSYSTDKNHSTSYNNNNADTAILMSNKANSLLSKDSTISNVYSGASMRTNLEDYENKINMMNEALRQEQQYLFIKEYMNQCQSWNPSESFHQSFATTKSGSDDRINTLHLAHLPTANLNSNELYLSKLNSPTTPVASNSIVDEIKYCSQYNNQATYIAPKTTSYYNNNQSVIYAKLPSSNELTERLVDQPANCQHSSLSSKTSPKCQSTETAFYDATYKQILTTFNQEKQIITNPNLSGVLLTTFQNNHYELNQLQKQQQQQHLRIAFRCQVCGSGFEDRHRLQQHLSIHLNLDPSWFEEKTIKETMAQYELKRGDYLCSTCNLRFETTAEYDKHMQLHGDKPHQCDLCSQDKKLVCFRYYRQLLTHLRSHCFLYSCRFAPDCKQTANRKDYLKLHILKHHLNNKLPYQYTICCH